MPRFSYRVPPATDEQVFARCDELWYRDHLWPNPERSKMKIGNKRFGEIRARWARERGVQPRTPAESKMMNQAAWDAQRATRDSRHIDYTKPAMQGLEPLPLTNRDIHFRGAMVDGPKGIHRVGNGCGTRKDLEAKPKVKRERTEWNRIQAVLRRMEGRS